MHLDETALANVEVKVADKMSEIEGSARILHDAYVARGLASPHPAGVRVTPHFLLPTTVTLVAKQGDHVIGTLSVIPDAPLGPPMEEIFGDAVAALRAEGRRMVELGALSVVLTHRRTG